MKNSDHRAGDFAKRASRANPFSASDDVEQVLETLLAACDEALAHGQDPTPLLERLADYPAEVRREFAETVACLRALKDRKTNLSTGGSPQRFGKFRLLKILGQGGFGTVWLAEDSVLGRKIALKVPRLHSIASPESAERFAREAQAAAALEHPNLVPMFEIGQVEGVSYLAMAYCEGPSLAQWLSVQKAPSPPALVAGLIEALAGAAAYMHERGIVHRDLKPSNVLLFPLHRGEKNGHADGSTLIANRLDEFIPKITDFGLAHRDDMLVGLTRTGVVLGTPAYMAPEQAWGKGDVSGPAVDIYALGAILYELLTGRPPFRGDTDLETLRQAQDREPIPPRRPRPELPRDLETICLKCLEKEPAQRYGAMTELAEDLRRFREGRPILARPTGRLKRTVKWCRRRPIVAGLAGLAGILLMALAVVGIEFIWYEQTNQEELANALRDADDQRSLAEKGKWLARSQSYPALVNRAWRQGKAGHIDALTEALRTLKLTDGGPDIRGFEWHYLWIHRPRDFLGWKHDSGVAAVAYAPDGETGASGGWDKTIHLFDVHDGHLLQTLRGHQLSVAGLKFFSDGSHLVSLGHEKKTSGVGFRSELLLWSLGAQPAILRRYTSERAGKLMGHVLFAVAEKAKRAFCIDPGPPDKLRMIDLVSGEETFLLTRPAIGFVATTAQADLIAFGGESLELYDPVHKRPVGPIGNSGMRFHTAAFSPNGKTLLAAQNLHDNNDLDFLDVPSRSTRLTLKMNYSMFGFTFDARGTSLAALALPYDPRHKSWDLSSGRRLNQDFGTSGACAVCYAPDGHELAIGDFEGHVHIRPAAANMDIILPKPLPESEAWCAAFTDDGQKLIVGYDHERGDHRETLKIWNLADQKGKALEEHRGTVMALAVSPGGKQLATAGYDGTVRLWDLAKQFAPQVLEGHSGPVRAIAYTHDGRLVASAGSDKTIKIWDTADGRRLKSWQAHDEMIRALAFTPDGKFLISGANDNRVKVWNSADWSLVRTIQEEHHVQSLACAPDGLSVAVANERNNVKLWDLNAGTLMRSFLGHEGKVRAVAFAPDGRTLASGGEDKTVRLWHVVTGQEMMSFPVEHFVNGLAFDRQGKRLAAALYNGMVRVWLAE